MKPSALALCIALLGLSSLSIFLWIDRARSTKEESTAYPGNAASIDAMTVRLSAVENAVERLWDAIRALPVSSNTREPAPNEDSSLVKADSDASLRQMVQEVVSKAVASELARVLSQTDYSTRASGIVLQREAWLHNLNRMPEAVKVVAQIVERVDGLRKVYGESLVAFGDEQALNDQRQLLIQEFIPRLARAYVKQRVADMFNAATGTSLLFCTDAEAQRIIEGR